ncbi:hepatitis A virus cellular receptor 1 homolog isoform X1 [Xiphophorus maculatus]|uniref:Hepatitis A virus cellular receptor 1 homolog n=1 Tax=Xiphophorus maculatus TaxID=8083 RepID=A0A3B5PRG7_XIPMA|nr:hepatitis A virus cellular receptor 1 homolog isoform X1 [Xiphophorus maculatus]XP_023184749.1 hepatitis A virus cellular receptor 1 homolog isoform X1 [Xiphophorus maculatus]XP_023184750.1 hepatitis A virus cellular receptor 1 homolog isoform X1 [Xiphophorus maculatus]XP_023184751.1 hepatitis A virus cellular receptor 1 homolog isoform X1 [Xiphophorus maculatus]
MWWQKYMAASLQDMPVQYPTPMCGLLIPFLLILIQVSSCTVTVTGYIGQDVTLPCSYDVQANGVLSFCWGHGQVPRSKCSNTILLSDNGNVTFRESPRYQLLSQVMQGDVSLTIVKAQKIDSGVYGCRVEIPGWFNDQKINVHLTMEEAPMEELDIQSSTDCDTVTVSKALLEAENIGRIAVIFFLTIILILILIIRRKVLMGRTTPQKLNTITAENIYETIPMTK